MTFKTAAKNVGNGFLTGLSAIADATTAIEIAKIDAEMAPLQKRLAELQEDRDRLEARY